MMQINGVLDTSFIVRYLTGDPREPAELARQVIDSDLRLGVTDVAIVETAYVLTSLYHKTRGEVADALAALVQRRNIVALGAEKEYVALGLRMCRASRRVSFGDAMIWAAARSRKIPVAYTFDERFPKDGIVRRPSE